MHPNLKPSLLKNTLTRTGEAKSSTHVKKRTVSTLLPACQRLLYPVCRKELLTQKDSLRSLATAQLRRQVCTDPCLCLGMTLEEMPEVKLHRMQMRKNRVSKDSVCLTLSRNIGDARHVILLVGTAGEEGALYKTSAGNISRIELCFLSGDCFIASLDYP